ncbi:hypothetical protein [Longispora urticae]
MRRWWVPGFGAVVVLSGFGPWFQETSSYEDGTSSYDYVTAWQASTSWTWALLLVAAVTVAWTGWTVVRGRVPVPLAVEAVVAVAAAGLLAVGQVTDIPVSAAEDQGRPVGVLGAITFSSDPAPERTYSFVVRDHLEAVHGQYYDKDLGWAAWPGIAGIAVLLLSILVTTLRDRREA